ncbi:MAG: hypothetical protein KAJ39_04105 [Gammaproteobacteria bacterium]|nr:hypothetical protein [Gammaproteobacteria bacterium]
MNILYIGSEGPLSLVPLQALIKSKHNVCAFAFDEQLNSDFNVINSGSTQSLALNTSIPLIKLNKNYSNVVSQIKSYQPDVILVSCYARLLPRSILSLAKKGCFNIHPSLLPYFRGPNPLFWQFRDGIGNFGITLHRMNSEFDAGNIVSQKKVEMYGGINKNNATKLLANAASNLILDFLDDVSKNNIYEVAQDNTLSSYQSYPTKNDYTVSTSWSAKRIYNFINGYKEKGVSFLCEVNGHNFKLVDVLSYQDGAYNNMGDKKIVIEGELITFACQSGYIQCQIKTD